MLDSRRIPGLDFLRAIAVLLVLLDHSGGAKIGPIKLFNGGLGVEIFFVLSGFLITWILLAELGRSNTIDLLAFYRRRIARLLPAYYGYVLVGVLYLWVRERPIPWEAVGAGFLYVLNYYQAFTGAQTHFLSHCWSLAVEEQFYFLWPFLLLLLWRRGVGLVKALIFSILAIWVLRAVLMLVFQVPDEYLYRALETRGDHLAVGCLLALVLRDERVRARVLALTRPVAVTLFLITVLASLLVISASFHSSLGYRYAAGYVLEPLLIAILLPVVVFGSAQHVCIHRVTQFLPIVIIGEVSYGIYLFHPLVLHPVRNFVERVSGSPMIGIAVSIAVLSMVAYVSFRWFERPIRDRFRG